ncbi:MAG: 4Fe-4S ferredoxin [Thermoprotei archaeon]|nr:MAG: 4Fe-4S ferredoxin [Thermoprotei archaeon]
MKYRPKVDLDKCIGDGACKRVCPAKPNVFELRVDPKTGNAKIRVARPEACTGCYMCVQVCPRQAITITER